MNRTTAENLLAQLIFDELDEPLKTELLAYLQTDAELAAHLDDMRQTVGLIELGSQSTEPMSLDAHRREKILRADGLRRPMVIFTFSRIAVAAAIVLLVIGFAGMILLPSLGRARSTGYVAMVQPHQAPRVDRAPAFDLSATQSDSDRQFGIFEDHAAAHGDVRSPGSSPAGAAGRRSPVQNESGVRSSEFDKRAEAYKRGQWQTSRTGIDHLIRKGEKSAGDIGQARGGADAAAESNFRLESSEPRLRIFNGQVASDHKADANARARALDIPPAVASSGVQFYPKLKLADSPPVVLNSPAEPEVTIPEGHAAVSYGAAVSSDASVAGAINMNRADRISGLMPTPSTSTITSINGIAYNDDLSITPRLGEIAGKGPSAPVVSKPEPLPQVAFQMDALAMAEERLQSANETSDFMIAEARRSMREGDVWEAKRTLDRLREETGIEQRERQGQQLAKLADKKEKLPKVAQAQLALSDAEKAKLGDQLEVLQKEIDLSYRLGGDMGMHQEAAQEMAQAVDETKKIEAEKPLTVGDEIGVATFDRNNPDDEHAWKMRVDTGGRIDVPQVGYFYATGRTPEQVRTAIAKKLKDLGRTNTAVALAVKPQPDTDEESAPAETYTEDAAALPPASQFVAVPVNPWVLTTADHFSTFGLDTDTASYTLARRYLHAGYRPPAASVRMEEFVNTFDYNYPNQSTPGSRTFAIHTDAAPAGELLPAWSADTVLLKIGVKAKTLGREGRKPAHLIFVIDASGSMAKADRLPLVQYALTRLVDQLGARDTVTVIAYRTEADLLVEHAGSDQRDAIKRAIADIQPRASTNLLAGLEAAYQIAARYYTAGQINRIIICSDGAANIGQTDAKAILDRIDHYRRQGITLTTAGFGFGNFNDDMMSTLAKSGDGNYVFIDSKKQADETFVTNLAATLQTVAKDAKIQVEFNPAVVRRYRLIGYERRDIADEDFRNDAVDAGEVGSGQSATALYQLELTDDDATRNDDLGTVFVRYRDVDTGKVEEISSAIERTAIRRRTVAEDPRFYLAACAAEFAEILRGSPYADSRNLPGVFRVMNNVAAALPLDQKVAELRDLIGSSLDKFVAP